MTKVDDIRIFKDTKVEIQNLSIEATSISGDRVTTTYAVTKRFTKLYSGRYAWVETSSEPFSSKTESFKFELSKISVNELTTLKKENVPFFVLKLDNNLFYSTLKDASIPVSLGKHCCIGASHACSRMKACSDEDGGCQKVRDVGRSKDISKYSFITKGIQTFNCPSDYNRLIVIECTNCEYSKAPRPTF